MSPFQKVKNKLFYPGGSVIRSVTIAFSLILLVLLAVSALSFLGAQKIERKYKLVVSDAMRKLELVSKLHENEDIIYNDVLGHLSTSSPKIKAHYEERIATVNKETTEILQQLRELLQHDGRLIILNEYEQERTDYAQFIQTHLKRSKEGKYTKAELISSFTLASVSSTQQRLLVQLKDSIRSVARERGDRAIESVTSNIRNFNLLLLVAMLLAIASGSLVQGIIKRLKRDNLLLNAEIKDRQQLEVALSESQRQYKNLFNYNPVPLWVYNLQDLGFIEVNEAAIKEYGYTREEFLELKLADIIAPEDAQILDEIVAGTARGASMANNWRHKRKDDTVFCVETIAHALPAAGDLFPGIVVAINVDERQRALRQLRHNEKQLREVSSSIPGAVFQFQLNAEWEPSFTFISEGIKRLYGVTPAEVYANAAVVYKHIHPGDQQRVRNAVRISSGRLTPLEEEYRLWLPEQEVWKWIRVHGLPTLKENVVTWNGTFIDITKQKEAQKKLIGSEANLRALLNSSPQAIYLLDDSMHVLLFNKVAMREVSTYLFKELTIGQSILQFIDEESAESMKENHTRAMQGETIIYETGRGNQWYEIAYRPIVGPDGKVLAVAFSTLDISEQKHTLETIRRSEMQLARAQQLAHLGNWEYDVQRDEMSWSDGVYSIFAINKDTFHPTILNKIAFVHPDDRVRVREKLEASIQENKLFTDEYRIVRADGKERVLYEIAETENDETGKAVKISGAVQDITDRKEAERAVTEAKNLLQSTLENIPEVIFSTDEKFLIRYISPQCLELTGFAEPAFYKKPALWFKMIHKKDRRMLSTLVIPNLLAGHRQQCEVRICTKDKTEKWLLLRLSPLLDTAAGRVVRIDGSAADMTQYKMAEEKRNQLTEELLRQNQNLQQFAYIVSHNLRAPIANILGLTSIYDRKQLNNDRNIKVIDGLQKSTRLLDTTIRDLNDILTIRSDIKNLQEEVYFNQILDEIKDSLSEDIARAGAEIVFDFHEAPSIITIKSYLNSIMLNLIANALKYRAPKRNLVVQLKTFRVPNYICLSVGDNGLGIDLEKFKDKIFGLYKRFHSGTDGKGIGLHLVKTQAELLGGRVEVESQVDVGTTFIVYFKS
ncbi:PAS domain S-box protein [Botryobacter ruber]|uniref:PAS domain S-box protein n=1 Tax=Botryobacter ruber TaxID=2171629 RepID=UPI0013E405E4|nr:PAS domain S-box protein [Botryobacter ruber]